MTAIVVIPARYDSTRFPGKPLAPLKGKPLVQHVYMNALGSKLANDVIVATDNHEILHKVQGFGGRAVMTAGTHQSGTDRISEVVRSMNYDIIVNVQGDEPLIKPDMIDAVITVLRDSRASIGTLAKRITDPREIFDPNVVKVVFDREGFAFYFSRAPVPYHRDEWKHRQIADSQKPEKVKYTFELGEPGAGHGSFDCFRHIGIYSYRKDVLIKLTDMKPSALELIERLEQLRAIQNNFRIKVMETSVETFGVDTPEDLERIEKCLNSSS